MDIDRDWNNIRLFLLLAESKTLDDAAEVLDVSRSTVSRHLTSFEKNLGMRLFDRTPSGLRLTSSAESVLVYAQDIRNQSRQFYQNLAYNSQSLSGKVTIATMSSLIQYIILPHLSAFYKKHPELQIEFVESPSLPNSQNRAADIILRFAKKELSDLIATKITSIPYGIYASSAVNTYDSQPLNQLPWLVFTKSQSFSPDMQWLENNVQDFRAVLRSEYHSTLLKAAENGVGVCLSPKIFASQYRGLKEIYSNRENLPNPFLWMSCEHHNRQIPKVAAVWSFLAETLKTSLSS